MPDVDTTRLMQELPESILATLAEIGEEINASLNLDRVLSKTASLIKRLIDYEIFTVMLLDRAAPDALQSLHHRLQPGDAETTGAFPWARASPALPPPAASPSCAGRRAQRSALHQCHR